jgi:glycosyltransferase involved in cell wall biosynthesis
MLFTADRGGGICSVLEPDRHLPSDTIDAATVRAACAALPRWTVSPVSAGWCIYLRGDVIGAVGLLDLGIISSCVAVHDWVLRAQALGFVAKRANHAYVHRWRPLPDGDAVSAPLDHSHALAELPHLKHQFEMFCKTLDGHLAAHAVRLQATGKLRVAYDIRHLPREQVGTRTYAVSLARALAELPEIELTLLVRDPAQAHGLSGRVVTAHQWLDDVAVIHKPAQVIDPHELTLLFGSSAHIVITYQDLIGYRIPHVFPTDAESDQYRATSSLTLPAVQRILAYSQNVGEEITAEFGIPREEIAVVPLGVEAGWFSHREERDVAVRWRLGLPDHYFLSLATDFPHKNLPNLLDAYALLRSRWRDGEPPGLVLAGHTSAARTRFYPRLGSNPLAQGLTILGPVSRDELRVLYQQAVALVFPSLYEGFGLPPLEAMAARTPVIAMRISALPEVGGDCVLYPDGLSTGDLARAMESLATDHERCQELRERGLRRVEQFRWENTARATLEAYRSAVLRPSSRSLHVRRHLRQGIIRWAEHLPNGGMPVEIKPKESVEAPQPLGIRNALRALSFSLHSRLKREFRRFQPVLGRRSA